ncbi:hypothetical protein [Kitasatospora sp. CB02891]|uniref:hypothetical protein n=1 Tax=Kitasatospora sp. CB02891 TaxID=2020329 RepID=UPI000CBF6CFB|nr:hypothetical protein [Kitasatospora sp. CB02891]PJN25380.1 hypothetical protein CG736_13230 [Kitasatospora sp. CB02891]
MPVTGLKDKPFLMIGSAADSQEDPGWKAGRPRVDGWKRRLTVAGSDHSTFTDHAPLFEQLGLPRGPAPPSTPPRPPLEGRPPADPRRPAS